MDDEKILPYCQPDAMANLERLMKAAARRRPSELKALKTEVAAAVTQVMDLGDISRNDGGGTGGASGGDLLDARFQLWRQVHRYIHAHPYRDHRAKARSAQWQGVLARVRDLGQRELIDWVCLQIEVARNLEKGIQDMRPRKNGPTVLVMLEYIVNQKRRALAALHWQRAAEKDRRSYKSRSHRDERI